VVLLALAVLQMCHASGVAGSGSVINVSRLVNLMQMQRTKKGKKHPKKPSLLLLMRTSLLRTQTK